MNELSENAHRGGTHEAHGVDEPIDGLLKEYFRREMPAPWPAPAVSMAFSRDTQRLEAVATSRHGWSKTRLALAASILLALGSYIGLTWIFPSNPVPVPGIPQETIGSLPKRDSVRPALAKPLNFTPKSPIISK